jgi:nicotinate-nucleotide adenylyltransferase
MSDGTFTRRRREVALLGGSFNPPHVAHLMSAYWVLATEPVAELWLLPAYRHPFGKELASFEDRVRMCELAAVALRGVRVSTVEAELADDPLVGKTVRTLEHLSEKHPDLRFAWVVGTDVLGETERWYRWERVQELARVITVGREAHLPDPGAGAPAARVWLPDVSSTEIRARLERGEDVSSLVPRAVLAYVRQRGLYGARRPAL